MAEEPHITEATLKATLVTKLQATHVEIQDMSGGCGQAFSALIVSPHFNAKTTLARNRVANAALKMEIARIHAWTAKCYTPEEWARVLTKAREEGGEAPVAPGKGTTGEVVVGTTA